VVEQYMRQVYKDTGYQEVKGPQILDRSLWEKTGHWQNYRDNMFTTESEKRDYALKPMNCPGHVLIFKSQLRSYRDLPLRCGEFVVSPGSGAFYGPKIEYTLKDAIGREWQCGTMQVDFNTAERLGAEYVTETSGRAHPVMLHRAIIGSMECFIGTLIENHAGALPVWLAPVQVAVLNITDSQADYAGEVAKTQRKQGIRVGHDMRKENFKFK